MTDLEPGKTFIKHEIEERDSENETEEYDNESPVDCNSTPLNATRSSEKLANNVSLEWSPGSNGINNSQEELACL